MEDSIVRSADSFTVMRVRTLSTGQWSCGSPPKPGQPSHEIDTQANLILYSLQTWFSIPCTEEELNPSFWQQKIHDL